MGLPVFADGGSFTNGIVSSPTAFNMGIMGEAGSEAIMPLTNVGGSLGVSAIMPDNEELVNELRMLRSEVQMLRSEARATALNTSKSARILDDVSQGGTELRTVVIA